MTEYGKEIQELFLRMMISDAQLYTRVSNILNSENFDKTLRPAVKFIKEYTEQYSSVPDEDKVSATTGVRLSTIKDLRQSDTEWFLNEFEGFTKRQELERAILKSADLLEKGNYDPVEKLIKDAVQISLTKDMGTDYFADPRARLNKIRNNNGQISTGWPCLDNKLYGGFNRGELQIFAGGSGSGKSLFMQNLAVNWASAGLNGVYITLELSEELCAWRIDSMLTDVATKEVFKNIDDVELKVKMHAKRAGRFYIKYLPAQSNVNDIRAYIKTLQIESGFNIDFVCIDYLDLLMPVSAKVSPSDLFVKDKYVSEEIRNLAKELQVLLVTASQLNRCLTLDTIVTANGRSTMIRDVKVGDSLASNDGDVKVIEVLPVTKQSVYRIRTKSGKTITCSAKHLFPTKNGLRNIENGLSIGDRLHTDVVEDSTQTGNAQNKNME